MTWLYHSDSEVEEDMNRVVARFRQANWGDFLNPQARAAYAVYRLGYYVKFLNQLFKGRSQGDGGEIILRQGSNKWNQFLYARLRHMIGNQRRLRLFVERWVRRNLSSTGGMFTNELAWSMGSRAAYLALMNYGTWYPSHVWMLTRDDCSSINDEFFASRHRANTVHLAGRFDNQLPATTIEHIQRRGNYVLHIDQLLFAMTTPLTVRHLRIIGSREDDGLDVLRCYSRENSYGKARAEELVYRLWADPGLGLPEATPHS